LGRNSTKFDLYVASNLYRRDDWDRPQTLKSSEHKESVKIMMKNATEESFRLLKTRAVLVKECVEGEIFANDIRTVVHQIKNSLKLPNQNGIDHFGEILLELRNKKENLRFTVEESTSKMIAKTS